MTGRSETCGEERVAYLERKLELLNQAIQLLGLSACSQCGKYFRADDRSARFEWRAPVCLECLEMWWLSLREQLAVKDRDIVERRLVRWLVTYHGGRVTQESAELCDGECNGLRIVAGCAQCDGIGQTGGQRCRGCKGRGAVWVLVPQMNGRLRQRLAQGGE